MIPRFGRPVPELCMITNTVLEFCSDTFSHKLTEWKLDILGPTSLERYAAVVFANEHPFTTASGLLVVLTRRESRAGLQWP